MLIDSYDRVVDYLRVSVTERCNFRCQYCMPEKPFSWVPKEDLLSFEELFEFVKVCIDQGVNKIRITGGEPTLYYQKLYPIIEKFKNITIETNTTINIDFNKYPKYKDVTFAMSVKLSNSGEEYKDRVKKDTIKKTYQNFTCKRYFKIYLRNRT